MGLTCPMGKCSRSLCVFFRRSSKQRRCAAPNVYCICCNDLDLNDAGGDGRIDDEECAGGALSSGINSNRQDHCVGMDAADEGSGGYVMDGYPLGVRAAPSSAPPAPLAREAK